MDLDGLLNRLAEVEPTEQPFISLYVDTRPDNTGRPHWGPTVRKELAERARSFGERTSARAAYDADAERILQWLESEPRPSAHGVAVFACGAAGGFPARALGAPGRAPAPLGPPPPLFPPPPPVRPGPRHPGAAPP